MKYFIDFQYFPKESPRPVDDGEILPIEITDEVGAGLIPSVGDYVLIDNSMAGGGDHAGFSGKVRSRFFRYFGSKEDESTCAVNIVVEETDDDFGLLVKE